MEEVFGHCKPHLYHLRTYCCKAYILIKLNDDVQFWHKYQKLYIKPHIGFMLDYESTNIYRVWIFIKKKVASIRDVIFDKDIIWDKKPILSRFLVMY